ncbi:hypothetical protein Tco_0460412, partial [Tanacetum coccineum]
ETVENQGRFNDEEMFDAGVLDDEEVFVEQKVAAKDLTVNEVTLDKGKGIMVESKKPMKKKDQISLDKELAFKLQDEEEEEE